LSWGTPAASCTSVCSDQENIRPRVACSYLFQAPTVEQLASRLCQSGSSAPSSLVFSPVVLNHLSSAYMGLVRVSAHYYYNLVPIPGPGATNLWLQPQGLDGLQLPTPGLRTRLTISGNTYYPASGTLFSRRRLLGGQNCLGDGSTTACARRESSYAGLFDTHGPESLKPLPVHVRASLANLLRLELKKLTYVQKS